MIKTKSLCIKIIFKTYLKILKIFQVFKHFFFYKNHRTVIKKQLPNIPKCLKKLIFLIIRFYL